jgi:hypothetical protein
MLDSLWADPESLAVQIERWLTVSAGHRETVDALVHLLRHVPAELRASLRLPFPSVYSWAVGDFRSPSSQNPSASISVRLTGSLCANA